jgi:hypothetical protein
MENIPSLGMQLLRAAIKVLSAAHKRRFWVGVLLGTILDGLRSASVFIVGEKEQLGLALNAIGTVPTVAVGITLAFAPLLFRKRVIDEEYTQIFNVVDEVINRAGLSAQYRKITYISVLDKIVKNLYPSRGVPHAVDLTNLGREAAQEVAKGSESKIDHPK